MTVRIPGVHVTEWGAGDPVLLIHGGDPFGGAVTFAAQQSLAERWHLLVPDRPGSGQSPRQGGQDFERDADLLLPLLDDEPTHVLGLSYGGMVATYMAMRRPDLIRSLTLIEAPLTIIAADDPGVAAFVATTERLFTSPGDPLVAVNTFLEAVGFDMRLPADMDPVPDFVKAMAGDLAEMRSPHDASIDVNALRRAGFPVLVLTSGRTAGFEGVAAALVDQLGAEHVIIPGTDHAVQRGDGVNEVLERFWMSVVRT